jgi:CRP/FNR family transcriptional regulator, cyclic AMP receptor protein
MGLETKLAQVPLLAGLDARTMERLAKHGTRRTYATGDLIIRQGDAASALYIILSGRVVVEREIEGGCENLMEFGPSEFFGEVALIENAPRTVSVRALEETECILLVAWEFTALVRESPDVAEVLLRELIRRTSREQHVVC